MLSFSFLVLLAHCAMGEPSLTRPRTQKVSLMIFDEAQLRKKEHVQTNVSSRGVWISLRRSLTREILLDSMQRYHELKETSPGANLPRILGMTASPVFNPKNIEETLRYFVLFSFPRVFPPP